MYKYCFNCLLYNIVGGNVHWRCTLIVCRLYGLGEGSLLGGRENIFSFRNKNKTKVGFC